MRKTDVKLQIKFDAGLHRQAKAAADLQGVTFRDWVTEIIKQHLHDLVKQAGDTCPQKRKTDRKAEATWI